MFLLRNTIFWCDTRSGLSRCFSALILRRNRSENYEEYACSNVYSINAFYFIALLLLSFRGFHWPQKCLRGSFAFKLVRLGFIELYKQTGSHFIPSHSPSSPPFIFPSYALPTGQLIEQNVPNDFSKSSQTEEYSITRFLYIVFRVSLSNKFWL